MPFTRAWDASCPLIYSQWESDGARWTVQDLRPEDDELAVEMMVDIFLPDEIVCSTKDIPNDPVGLHAAKVFWLGLARARCSIACYREQNAQSELVALNMCAVNSIDDPKDHEKSGSEAWDDLIEAIGYLNREVDLWKGLGVEKYLSGAGLMVRRDVRGARLGAKLLEARELMCRALGVKATVNLFTGPASQKLAERVGFKELASKSFADYAAAGLKLPPDHSIVMKLMAKSYIFE